MVLAEGVDVEVARHQAGVLFGHAQRGGAEGTRFVPHLHQVLAFFDGQGDQQIEVGFEGGQGAVDALQAVGLERHGDAVLCHVLASFQVVPAGSDRHTQPTAPYPRCDACTH